jgi:hypothetical protein
MIRLLCIWLLLLLHNSHAQAEEITADAINLKCKNLITQIIKQQQADGSWSYQGKTIGATALHLLALSSAKVKEQHPAIQKGLNFLLNNFPKGDVYAMGLFASALQEINHRKYKQQISQAAAWLVQTQKSGTWNYTGTGIGDNSVTQFALLGIKAALNSGVHIPPEVLIHSKKHFISTQKINGGWGYTDKSSPSSSMTAAALASLAICKLEEEVSLELSRGPKFCGIYKRDSRIKNGFDWLGQSLQKNPSAIFNAPYNAYAHERAGIFYDKKAIGELDWYTTGATIICQSPIHTGKYLPAAFKLLFLTKGNRPILFSKVKWGQQNDWQPRHRDVRNLSQHISTSLDQQIDWQVTTLNRQNKSFGKAPILYISGLKTFLLNQDERLALKSFIENKGTVLIAPCLKSPIFINSITKELQSLFPGTQFKEIPSEHKIRRMFYNLQKSDIPLKVLKSSCNSKNIFLCTSDISLQYEANTPLKPTRYSLTNLIKLALKNKPLIEKLNTPTTKPIKLATQSKLFINTTGASSEGIDITQILFGKDLSQINPDPLNHALGFMRKSLKITTKKGINLLSLNNLKALQKQAIIYMTGTAAFELSTKEKSNLTIYLKNGGFLFADARCSCAEFHTSFQKLITEIFTKNTLDLIPLSSPIHSSPFKLDISFSKALKATHDQTKPFLRGLKINKRYAVIYSPFDITTSLNNQLDEESKGVKQISALKLISNIISYGLSF